MGQQDHILEADNYILFCNQLKQVITKYPHLRIKENVGLKYLKGVLDIPDDNGLVVNSFLIEIHFTKGFPYEFPILLETGGAIGNEANWHKYNNGACCITVTAKEILICKNGLAVIDFIEKHAISFFANFIYKKLNGKYKNGEYGHWIIGPIEFYTDLLKTVDQKLWRQYFHNVFKGLLYNDNRNSLCFCGSKRKFKLCHRVIFETLKDIGEKRVNDDFDKIYKESQKLSFHK